MKKIFVTLFLLPIIPFFAQNVGINSTGALPNASAMLDVVSTDKGLLIPRVNIIDLATAAPITAPATSLLVYNTNATSGVGYYFWDGTKWTKLSDANTTSDHDWYEVGGTSAPDNITDEIFTYGKVGIGISGSSSTLAVHRSNLNTSFALSSDDGGANLQGFSITSDETVDYVHIDVGGTGHSTDRFHIGDFVFPHNNVTMLANLGIGTVSPYNKLHIYDQVDGVFSGLAVDNRKTYGVGTGTNETSRVIMSLTTTAFPNPNNQVMAYIEGGTMSETTSAGGFMALGTRNGSIEAEKVRILNNGNVGIGTPTPSEKLEIAGSIKIVDGTEGVGKVLTSDALGKGSWTLPASSQVGDFIGDNGGISNVTYTSGQVIPMNNEILDPDNLFTFNAGKVVVANAGVYNITAHLETRYNNAYLYWDLIVDGTVQRRFHATPTSSGISSWESGSVSALCSLNSGSEVWLSPGNSINVEYLGDGSVGWNPRITIMRVR